MTNRLSHYVILLLLPLLIYVGYATPVQANVDTAANQPAPCTGTQDPQTSSCFVPQDVGTNAGNPIVLQSPFGFGNLSQAINTIVTAIIFFAAIVAFIYIVIGAFRYVTAGDDAAGTKAARTIITNAVVGLILVALVYVIFQIAIRTVPGLKDIFQAG